MRAGRPRANKSEYDCSNLHILMICFFAIVAIMHGKIYVKDVFFQDDVWLLCMTLYASDMTPIIFVLCSAVVPSGRQE